MIREGDAHLLENVEGPFHPRIERARDEYFTRKKEEEQRNLQDKALKYFENAHDGCEQRRKNFGSHNSKKRRQRIRM